eukprot:8774217-Pyramimonas_sp.AAC.1
MVVVLARSSFPLLHRPRSDSPEPATGPGELPASFHVPARAQALLVAFLEALLQRCKGASFPQRPRADSRRAR